ncbi:MAG: GDSL-type esterase/lipase family protein [Bifidobacterium sp.]|nr:GDSL-type esterase/lipase family protein [Bifidobacterium sp.]
MRSIPSTDPAFLTEVRVDATAGGAPLWVFPYTQARFRFTGTSLAVRVRDHWNYGDIRLGVAVDGRQFAVRVPSPAEPSLPAGATLGDDGVLTLPVVDGLPGCVHDAVVFKRQDGGMHYLEFHGVQVDDGARIAAPVATATFDDAPLALAMAPGVPPLADGTRRIEFYGDSVTCGERNEATAYLGQLDPEVDLSAASNAWYSYAAIAARALGARARLIAQGGASLLDGIGWFNGPDYLGMESMWDRVRYNPALGGTSRWDFAGFTPQVVVVALGQNDTHPRDFMALDYDGDEARHWRARYADFLRALRSRYPRAHRVHDDGARARPRVGPRDRRGGRRLRRCACDAFRIHARRLGHAGSSAHRGGPGDGGAAGGVRELPGAGGLGGLIGRSPCARTHLSFITGTPPLAVDVRRLRAGAFP